MSEFMISPARREEGPVTISLAGMSGSGKTYSALLLARGLVGDEGKVVVIDTEGNRALIYADDPDVGGFLHMDMRPPFSSNRTKEAIQAAIDYGADCVILDSASHEHNGEGGLLDFAYAEEERLRNNAEQRGRQYKDSFAKWIKPKQAHNQFVQKILGAPCHVISTLRQHEVTVVDAKKQGGGRVGDKVVSTICDSQFVFEMTLAVILDTDHKPTYVKVPKPLQEAIRQGEPITKAHGALLAAESRGEAPEASQGTIRYEIHYPGGKTVPYPDEASYVAQILKSASKAGDKLAEFRKLNGPFIQAEIKDTDLVADLLSALGGGKS